MFCLVLYFLTFLIFPGLITSIVSEYNAVNNASWMPVILITEYNIGDYVGRKYIASWTSLGLNHETLYIASCIRFILYPLFIFLYKGYLISDIVAHLTMIIFAVSNGHLCCLAFIFAPQLVNDYEQQTCAAIMSSALVSGLFVGTASALLISLFL